MMVAAAGVALSSLPGCAFIFSEGAPPPERQAKATYFDCSDSYVPAIVDSALAASATLAASEIYSDRMIENAHNVAAIEAGFAALFLTSAAYGYHSVAGCHAAKNALLERRLREELLPPPYGMPPWGQPPPYWPPPLPLAYRATAAPPPPPARTPPPPPAALPPPAVPTAPIFKPAPPAEPATPVR